MAPAQKRIAILGSTGSIGTQTLEVIAQFPEQYSLFGVAAGNNIHLLAQQIKTFRPTIAVLAHREKEKELRELVGAAETEILTGEEGLLALASAPEVDMVVTAMVGSVGLKPTLKAIESGKDIAIANKETLVSGGSLVMPLARRKGVKILPIDSEHSAIFQCLAGENHNEIQRLILTASGGALRDWPLEKLAEAEVEHVLQHPTWVMGRKITVDSATLINKGLEVIEAHWLFGVDYDHIQVVIHPQSIVHSLVEFKDTSIKSQMGLPDMKVPIAYALSYPKRNHLNFPSLDLWQMQTLTFREVNPERYPGLRLAYEAGKAGGTLPAVFNAANEAAVGLFLEDKMRFMDIPRIIEKVMDRHQVITSPSLDEILEADGWARRAAADFARSVPSFM